MYDELDLDMLGDERTALFLIMSDTDGTFAFLISLIYSILFNRLCERADDVYGGRLPIHVRCLIDEAANIGQIPNLERLMATIRSREISACLVLQAQSQLKALYKDNMDTIIGNCDASLFLGGKEETTLKSWNSLLGKETSDLYNTSVTKGTQESHGQNFQKLGKEHHRICNADGILPIAADGVVRTGNHCFFDFWIRDSIRGSSLCYRLSDKVMQRRHTSEMVVGFSWNLPVLLFL